MTIEKEYQDMLALVRTSLWGKDYESIENIHGDTAFQHMKQHAISVLPASSLGKLTLSDQLRISWKKHCISHIARYYALLNCQNELLTRLCESNIGVIVLKGTSAADYYPHPEYRVMGDVDIIVCPEDYDKACIVMLQCGWKDVTTKEEDKRGRHRSFIKANQMVQLHHAFSFSDNVTQNGIIDKAIYSDIVLGRTVPSDEINGLVFICHIAQHLNGGIGLRQIIDWMMFADKCLSDSMWREKYEKLFVSIGMCQLAKVVTRMCQLYLGLRMQDLSWCTTVDVNECDDLLDYVLRCGNFGQSRLPIFSRSLTLIPSITHPLRLFHYLQQHGEKNWNAIDSHPFLKPFAWIYQTIRYIRYAKESNEGLRSVNTTWREASKRKKLFAKLGVPIR